jgi:hypothetical protein
VYEAYLGKSESASGDGILYAIVGALRTRAGPRFHPSCGGDRPLCAMKVFSLIKKTRFVARNRARCVSDIHHLLKQILGWIWQE